MKILVTGGTGLVGHAIQSISKNFLTLQFYFQSISCLRIRVTTLVSLSNYFDLWGGFVI